MPNLHKDGKDEDLGRRLDIGAVVALGKVRAHDGAVLVVGVVLRVLRLVVAARGHMRCFGRLTVGGTAQEVGPARQARSGWGRPTNATCATYATRRHLRHAGLPGRKHPPP